MLSNIKQPLSTMELKLIELPALKHGQASVIDELGILQLNIEDNKGILSAGCPNLFLANDLFFFVFFNDCVYLLYIINTINIKEIVF